MTNRVLGILLLILLVIGLLSISLWATGFQFTDKLEFGGYQNGVPVWKMKGISFVASDPIFQKHFKSLEGKRVILLIEEK